MPVTQSRAARHRRVAAFLRGSPLPVAGTIALLTVEALLLSIAQGRLAAVVVASVALLVAAFRQFLRSGRAFGFALANLIGIYACVFLFFTEINFNQVGGIGLSIGYVMPLLAFLLGSVRRRREIHRIVLSGRVREEQHFGRVLVWLAPVFGVGALTSFLPHDPGSETAQTAGLMVGMFAISAIVFAVSHDVAVFLLDTGILFEEFFGRIKRLVVPAFAFLTFYSLLVVLFASLYFIADHLSGSANFRLDGAMRAITFAESLYFSLMTLSTVGYGDISPASNIARFMAATEVVCGIMLLLFGFNEIFSFAQEQARRQRDARPPSSGDRP